MSIQTFVAFIAAIGIGSIISAVIGHHIAISNHRQAWINALRDDIAEYVKLLEKMAYAMRDFLRDSQATGVEQKRRDARADLLFIYERIRLRLNRDEDDHLALERALSGFINEPLLEMLEDRQSINNVIDISRRILKDEWRVTKYPWLPYIKKGKKWLREHILFLA
jgi:hypothetical protein